jgi:hypothetical protein
LQSLGIPAVLAVLNQGPLEFPILEQLDKDRLFFPRKGKSVKYEAPQPGCCNTIVALPAEFRCTFSTGSKPSNLFYQTNRDWNVHVPLHLEGRAVIEGACLMEAFSCITRHDQSIHSLTRSAFADIFPYWKIVCCPYHSPLVTRGNCALVVAGNSISVA